MFRRGWSTVTATGKTIDDCLKNAIGALPRDPRICVALVSKSFPDYGTVARQLGSQINAQYTIGCVVDHVPRFRHGISILASNDNSIVPFHIPDSPDRHKVRSISVGRWGRKELKGEWKQFGSVSQPSQALALPSTLQTMTGTPSMVFLATDNEPDQLLQALDHHFPQTNKLGIVGASTPFVTGHPHTLICQNEILGAGMVGFAAYDRAPTTDIDVFHPALEALGEPMTITRCRGNIILDLDQSGATGLLLSMLQQGRNARIEKDQDFYLGIYPLGTTEPAQMSVNRVTSGDPSRGNMSVDTTADLQVGQVVQSLSDRRHLDGAG
ncbi:hypothetical protein BX666DRAFT_1881650 [Dichotomocladium elegans]|nr:hypothetical protein BX666DRAFT_1881650 [Dichotomocladium elegans]